MTRTALGHSGAARAAVFLDRDGTINRDHGYVHTPEQFEFLPGAPQAIARLNRAGLWVFVVTNQSGVARGYYPESDVTCLHQHLARLLADHGAHVDAYYHCPDHPEGQGPYRRESARRKPAIGMFEQACREFPVLRDASWMVGDKPEDIQFAVNAGLRAVLVLSGQSSRSQSHATSCQVRSDLGAAVELILGSA